MTSPFHSDSHLVTSHMFFVHSSLSFVLFPSLFPSVSLTVSWSNSAASPCIWISVGLWQTQHTCQSCNTNTQTHTHTHLTLQQSVSFSLSLSSVWLTVWPARGINALLWRCRVWMSLPACHIHLEREGKGKLGGSMETVSEENTHNLSRTCGTS